MAARHAAVAAQAARSRGRGHVTKGGVRWGAAGTGHGGLLAGRRRFVRKGRDVGEHWALGVSGSAGAHWFSQPRAGLAGAARRGAWADAPLREVGQKRPPCRHARPDLPPRAAPRVSTPLGCCAAAPARVAGAPMQRREVEPRACRPPARCAAGERGGRGGERLQCFLRRRVLSHASRTALSPPRSAPAPGGTPATFPSGVSATPPPRAPSDPPRPACARAGGGAGQRMAPTCLWRASVARAVSKVASWMSKLAPSPSATSGWHGRVSPEHTTLHPRAPGSGGARSSTPVAWRHECRTSTVLIATPSRAASCERAPP